MESEVNFLYSRADRLSEQECAADAILGQRVDPATEETEYLVKWSGWDSKFNTWEPESNLVGTDVLAQYKATRKSRRSGAKQAQA
jgi:hypothetical protein